MSILFTYIARVKDGLILVASLDQGTNTGDMEGLKQQAKSILKTLDARSAARLSIDSTHHTFNYVIDEGICFMTLSVKPYPQRLAFSFLDEIRAGFLDELHKDHGDAWRSELDKIGRPYAYIKFDKYIQKQRRAFSDVESRESRSKLKEDITEVQSIMRKNINEVLDRGSKLEHVSQLSRDLHDKSKKWHWGAKRLNLMEMWKKYMPIVVVVALILFLLYYFVM